MKRAGATQRVYDFIIEKIKSHEWAPGTRIPSEAELGLMVGTSRLPVREALDRLAAVGLIQKRHGSGSYVMDVNSGTMANTLVPLILIERDELSSVLQFRLYFETGNMEIFMRHPKAEILEELDAHYGQMVKKIADQDAFAKEDLGFHDAIARGTKNPFIIKISQLLNAVLLSHQEHLYASIGSQVGINFHKQILEAIKRGDSQMSVLLMRRHIEETIRSVSMAQEHYE